MRPIKFRVWSEETKRMIEFDLSHNFYVFKKDVQKTIMQYIGLKDKNGKDIYEGDIVEYRDFSTGAHISFSGKDVQPRATAVIEIDNLLEGLNLKGFGFVKRKKIEETVEVIGNIHENSELLKEAK